MDFQRGSGGAEELAGDRPRFTFEQDASVADLSQSDRESSPGVIGGRPHIGYRVSRADTGQLIGTWEHAAEAAARSITSRFDIRQHTLPPENVIAILDAHLTDLTKNYFDAPLYGRAQLADAFERIGRTVLGGWIHETNDTIDSHIGTTLRTIAAKHHDYSSANITRWGIRGICTRMGDKHARLENLYRRGVRNALFETIEDTWLDLLGYSIIALMLIDETFTLPLERDLR